MLALTGRRILVTRSRQQASELALLLEALGATTILVPTIEIAPPLSFAPLDQAISGLNQFDWMVFTSVNAVRAFGERLKDHPSNNFGHIKTAAIGPATAHAASQIGLNVVLVPPTAVAESLSATLLETLAPGSSVLLVRAAVARDHLPDALIADGVQVTIAEAYRTRIPDTSISDLKHVFGDPSKHPHAITFASSSTVTNFLTLLEAADLTLPPSIIRASIGRVTTQTLCEHGLPPHLQARDANLASLTDSLAAYMKKAY